MMKKKKIINLDSAKEFVRKAAGEDAIRVVRIYERKGKSVTDEELAKKMRLKVTEIRTILNRLHYRGIVCYQRTKNTKTGWYSYTWSVKSERIADLLLEELAEKMEKLESKQTMQTNYGLFSCKTQCDMIPFEVAAEYNFKCPECGRTMGAINTNKERKVTEKMIEEVKSEIDKINRTT